MTPDFKKIADEMNTATPVSITQSRWRTLFAQAFGWLGGHLWKIPALLGDGTPADARRRLGLEHVTIAYTERGTWQADTDYDANDLVWWEGSTYGAMVSHHSGGSFKADLDAGLWRAVGGDLAAQLQDSKGSAGIGFIQRGTGAVLRAVQDELRRTVSIEQFGAVSGTDCSAAVQAAVSHIESLGGYDLRDSGGTIEFGPGLWYFNNVRIGKFGVRFKGAGKRATLLANADRVQPMLIISQGDTSVTGTISEIEFENLQFRNTVNRSDGSGFIIQGNAAERLCFLNVDFVSSAISTNKNRSALRCDFLKTDTFESRWSHCNFWGIIGCAVEIPNGPQSDTLLFDHCVWQYCTLGVALGCGAASGINNPQFLSCKVVANQGGTYTSCGNDSFAQTVTSSESSGNVIHVRDATGFTINRCIAVGRNTPQVRYAFVRAINGTNVTLDRSIQVDADEDVVHGTFGFILGHVHTPEFNGVQLEGCDVGIYGTVARQLSFSGSVGSCARSFLFNGGFRYLKIGPAIGFTSGTMRNGISWQFLTVISTPDSASHIELSDCDCEGSGYYDGTPEHLVTSTSSFDMRIVIRSRLHGTQYFAENRSAVTWIDSASLTFNRTDSSKYARARWQTAGEDEWFMDFGFTNGDLYFKKSGMSVQSFTLSGYNGVPVLGDGAWNGVPVKIGKYYLWVDSDGRLRIKNGAPTSETSGVVVGTQS